MNKNLTDTVKNAFIYEIELDEKYKNEFHKKMFTVLRKFSTSRKTKIVHKLIDNDLIRLAIFSGDVAHMLGAPINSNTKLKAVFLNIFMFDDSLDQQGAVQIAGKIEIIRKKIQKEKTYLTDKQILNIETLNEELDAEMEKLLNKLDYIKIIDGIYFEYIRFLAYISLTQDNTAKSKIVTIVSDIISAIIKKLYFKVNREIDPEIHQIIEAVSVYFILTYYFGETGPYALAKMKPAFKPEILDKIKMAKLTKFKKFSELAILLKELDLINITESAFEAQLQKIYGRYAYEEYLAKTLQEFMAVNANLAYNTQLFNAFPIDGDLHARIEELILNEKKKITFG